MAKINPVKLKQDADKLEKSGKIPEAIALYKQVIDDNPRDWNVINKVGDLYAKQSKFREASDYYGRVADFYAKDGFHLKAIAIWKKINKLDPGTLDPYLNLAELYGKQGLMMEAKSQYQYVVDEYIKRGKMRDAGEVLRKMADIDPSDLKIRSKLADLYIREGNTAKAVEEHIAIAEELNKKGHLAEALQVLEKGLKIDPKSSRLRVELSRVHLVQKNFEKAAHFLEEAVQHSPSDTEILARLGEAYLGSKKIEEAEAIFKRLLELDPGDDEARAQMARVYLIQDEHDRAYEEMEKVVEKLVARRDGERAASLLQQIVLRNPSHLRTLNRLVELYQQLGKDSEVLATYSRLTEAYIQQGQLADAAGVLEILVEREPQNQQHRTKLEFVRGKLAGGAPAAPPAADVPDFVEEEFDLTTDDESTAPEPAPAPASAPKTPAVAPPPRAAAPAKPPAPPAARSTIEVSGPLSEEDKEFIEEHLAEGKVFRKYGLIDKAADQFEAVIARFPDNAEARQELRDVYKDKSLPAKAAEQSLALAEIFRLRGDEAAASAQEEEAELLAPGSAPRARPAAAAPVIAAPAPAPVRPPAAAATPKAPSARTPPAPPPPALEPEPEDVPFAVEEEVAFGEAAEEEIPLDVEEATSEPSMADEFDLGPELEAGATIPSHFIEDEPAVPVPIEEARSADDGELSLDDFPLEEPIAPPPAIPAPPPPPRPVASPRAQPAPVKPSPLTAKPAAAAPPPAAGGVPAELTRILDEIDSYVSLGFVDDAKEALSEASVRFAGHPAIAEKMAELGLEEAADAVAELPAESPFDAPGEAARQTSEGLPLDEELVPEMTSGAEFDLEAPALAGEEEDVLGELGSLEAAPSDDEFSLGTEELLAEATKEMPPPAPLPPSRARVAPPPPAILEAEEEPITSTEDLLGMVEAGPPPGEGIDLGDELGELFGAQAAVEEEMASGTSTELGDAGLADIFKEFKKGVDKQLGKEDYDTRYNLGIAYKEMGLIDEAIAEFQLAAKDENRMLECSSMLGICFMEKGMPKLAIKWFEKGLKVLGRSDDEYTGLRYDLASAYEASGEVDRALSLFTDLYGQDANFRDVAAKVRDLRSARP